jgi:D-glycero-D-manno-heptose 1,7-bisphosphate phosphatase
MTVPVVFLDRDGTVNVDHGFVHRIEDWEFLDAVPQAIRSLRDAGFAIALVTNQSGVGRGYYALDAVQSLHERVQQRLAELDTRFDAIAVCPHLPSDGCTCRKPRTAMATEIERQLAEPIAYTESWTIGDKISDIGFGRNLGTRTALLHSRYWDEAPASDPPDLIADSLYEAAQAILERLRTKN